MIRYLVVATLLVLVAACGEATPTRWPTTTPVPTPGSPAASGAEPAGIPDTSSGDAATVVPADKAGDSAAGDSAAGDKMLPEIVLPGIAPRRTRLLHPPVGRATGIDTMNTRRKS